MCSRGWRRCGNCWRNFWRLRRCPSLPCMVFPVDNELIRRNRDDGPIIDRPNVDSYSIDYWSNRSLKGARLGIENEHAVLYRPASSRNFPFPQSTEELAQAGVAIGANVQEQPTGDGLHIEMPRPHQSLLFNRQPVGAPPPGRSQGNQGDASGQQEPSTGHPDRVFGPAVNATARGRKVRCAWRRP